MIEKIEERYEYMIKVLGKIPKILKMSKNNYKTLVKKCLGMDIESNKLFDRNGNAVAPFLGMKIVIDNSIINFRIE